MKDSFKAAIKAFAAEAKTAIDDLQNKIDKEEEKDEINDEKVDELSELKDDIEAALNAVEEINIGE